MRIALRNKDKISAKLGADILNILENLLKEYSSNNHQISSDNFDIKSGDTIYQFRVIRQKYDVVVVAYRGESKATP